jgi:hypothetical protein
LFLLQALTLAAPFQAAVISVPAFYTPQQLQPIADGFRGFRIPVVGIVPDSHAILMAYSAFQLNRFELKPKHVLFVDVGATSTKAFSGIFTYQKETTKEVVTINQTSGEWTELVGGYYFAKKVAISQKISLRRAQKMLVRSAGGLFENLFEKQIATIKQLIGTAISRAEKVRPIDEIQVVGQASVFNFVEEAISAATASKFRRDLNETEAVALGAVIASLRSDDPSPYIKPTLSPLPPYSLTLNCGPQTAIYTIKSEIGNANITFEDLDDICPVMVIAADPSTLPSGVPTEFARLIPKANITLNGTGKYTAKVQLTPPDPMITKVEWCQADSCQTVDMTPQEPDQEAAKAVGAFISAYVEADQSKMMRKHLQELLGKVNQHMALIGQGKVEPPLPVLEEHKTTMISLNVQNQTDGFASMDRQGLSAIRQKLEEVANAINVPR